MVLFSKKIGKGFRKRNRPGLEAWKNLVSRLEGVLPLSLTYLAHFMLGNSLGEECLSVLLSESQIDAEDKNSVDFWVCVLC